MASESPWEDWEGAARYAAFVREFGLYRRLNRELVERADLAGAQRVLDLACGTGATAQAALERMGPSAALVGVDGSQAMVAMARGEVTDARARFLVAPAAGLRQAVEGRFDRVLCNAAFWQFPSPGVVAEAVAAILEPGGTFVFNLPAERLGAAPGAPGGTVQLALARAVEQETGCPWVSRASRVQAVALEGALRHADLMPTRRERVSIPTTEGELLELMALPAMIARAAPDLAGPARERALARAARSIRPDAPVDVDWEYWVVRSEPPEETR